MRNVLIALGLYVVALCSLLIIEASIGTPVGGQVCVPFYAAQAQNLLHGRWDIDNMPAPWASQAWTSDVISLHGHHYLYYPPFPAVLMLPLVAAYGLFPGQILFAILLPPVNLPLMYLLFEQVRASGLSRRRWGENLAFAGLLFYGSIGLWMSMTQCMWYTQHIVAMACTLLSLLLAFRKHFGWAAALLGGAFFSRYTVALGFPFLFYLAWQDGGTAHLVERFASSLRKRQPDWKLVPWRRFVAPAGVTAGIVALFLAHNAAVFSSPLDTGYTIMLSQRFPQATDGAFSLRYIPANFVAYFLTFPRVFFSAPLDRHPIVDLLNDRIATSFLATTPLFLLLFWRNSRFSLMRVALWLTVGAFFALLLPFVGAGFLQFGTRYLFDVYPYMFLLLVLNEFRLDWRALLLGGIGIAVNLFGAFEVLGNQLFHV